jgi:hypothetical protein
MIYPEPNWGHELHELGTPELGTDHVIFALAND